MDQTLNILGKRHLLSVAPQIFVFNLKAFKESSKHFLLISTTKCHKIYGHSRTKLKKDSLGCEKLKKYT